MPVGPPRGSTKEAPPIIASRAADVIDLRRELVNFFAVKGELQHLLVRQGRRSKPELMKPQPEPVEDEKARRQMHESLHRATLYWVSPEMTELISHIAPSIPDTLPRPPVPEALVVFAKPIPGIDAVNEIPIHTAAYQWCHSITLGIPCISSFSFGWRDYMEPTDGDKSVDKDFWRNLIPIKLVLTGSEEWPKESKTSDFSVLEADTPAMHDSILEDRQLLSCFWALCDEKITIESRETDRYAIKRATRSGIENLEPVRVIRLREVQHRPRKEGPGADVEWSHRWYVQRHWRNQYYPSLGEHRPKLIRQHIKGPDDKPLVVRESVNALVR